MIVSTLNIWIIMVTSKLYSNFDAMVVMLLRLTTLANVLEMQFTVQRPLKIRSLKFLVV